MPVAVARGMPRARAPAEKLARDDFYERRECREVERGFVPHDDQMMSEQEQSTNDR